MSRPPVNSIPVGILTWHIVPAGVPLFWCRQQPRQHAPRVPGPTIILWSVEQQKMNS